MSFIGIALIVVIAFFINRIYHKVFHVFYIGCMSVVCEWFACLFLSTVIVSILLSPFTI